MNKMLRKIFFSVFVKDRIQIRKKKKETNKQRKTQTTKETYEERKYNCCNKYSYLCYLTAVRV